MKRTLSLIALLALVTGCAETPRTRLLVAEGTLEGVDNTIARLAPYATNAKALRAVRAASNAAKAVADRAYTATTRPADSTDAWLDLVEQAVSVAVEAAKQMQAETPVSK